MTKSLFFHFTTAAAVYNTTMSRTCQGYTYKAITHHQILFRICSSSDQTRATEEPRCFTLELSTCMHMTMCLLFFSLILVISLYEFSIHKSQSIIQVFCFRFEMFYRDLISFSYLVN